MKKLLLFSVMCLMALTIQAQTNSFFKDISKVIGQIATPYVEVQYVDMGLPSGTRWKKENEPEHYRYADAINKFGKNLPSISQWDELRSNCTWTWVEKENGYKVVGPNGNYIYLLSAGFRNSHDWKLNSRGHGQYWSSTTKGTDYAWCFNFWAGKVEGLDYFDTQHGLSVRLVLNR